MSLMSKWYKETTWLDRMPVGGSSMNQISHVRFKHVLLLNVLLLNVPHPSYFLPKETPQVQKTSAEKLHPKIRQRGRQEQV